METKLGPATGGQGSRRGLLWGLIIAVVVLAAVGIAAVVVLWPAEERATVPDLVDMDTDAAQRVLEAAGLELGDVERVTVDAETAEADTVISQAPSAGTEVDSGSQVALVATDVAEEAGEDEAATPPAASGGGSESGGGGGAQAESAAEPDTDVEAEPESTWRSIAGTSGRGTYRGTYTSTARRLQLTVIVSSPTHGDFAFRSYLTGGGRAIWLIVPRTTPAATEHVREEFLDVGEKNIWISCTADCEWTFKIREWR